MQNFCSKAAKKVDELLREGVTDEEKIKEFYYWLGYRNGESGVSEVNMLKANLKVDYNEFTEQYIIGYEDAKADMEEDNLQNDVPF